MSIIMTKSFVVFEFLVNSRFQRIEKEKTKKQISIGMKKIILSLAAVLVFTLTSDAQTRKGTVLLGAGSEVSNSMDTYNNGRKAWTQLNITPKVGYFVQDGVAIGALINFQSNNEDRNDYELNSGIAEIGVFGRYYVSNNLFSEIALSSMTQSDEVYEAVVRYEQAWTLVAGSSNLADLVAPGTEGASPLFDDVGNPEYIWFSQDGNPDLLEVVETSMKTLNLNLGLGYLGRFQLLQSEHTRIQELIKLIKI